MKRFLLLFSIVLFILPTYPRKMSLSLNRTNRTENSDTVSTERDRKHKGHRVKMALRRPQKQNQSLRDESKENFEIKDRFNHADTVKSKSFLLIILYNDSVPLKWILKSNSRFMSFDFDPRKLPVFFNSDSPKYFHSNYSCKKLGDFRKLPEFSIDQFLKKNKSAFICPVCAEKSEDFFFISQFILEN